MKKDLERNNLIKIVYKVAPYIMLLVYAILHLYRLSEVPRGLYVDEMGMAYDAWSLGQYGVDRYLKSWPLYLINFGGGQSILYCYLDILFIKLGGITPLMIRMPAFVFSMITCIFGYKLIKENISNRAGLVSLFLFCVLPYFTIAGRIALDCNLMLGMSTMMLYQLGRLLKVKEGENIRHERSMTVSLFLLGITIGVTLYTYALSYIIIPLFLIMLVIYLAWCRRVDVKSLLISAVPVAVLGLPLVAIQIINIFDLPEKAIGPFTLTKIVSYRGGEISLSYIKDNLRWLYVSLFKVDITEFDNFAPYSNLYIISIPILVIGLICILSKVIKSVKDREFDFDVIIMLWVGVICAVSLIITGVTTYRINAIFIGLLYIIVRGIEWIYGRCRYIVWGLLAVYVGYFISFSHFYFTEYEYEGFPQRLFTEDMTDAINLLESYDEEITSRPTCVLGVNEGYVYYFSSKQSSPYNYDALTYGNNGDGLPDENGDIKDGSVAFWTVEPYDARYNYIIYCPEDEQLVELEGMNFDIIRVDNFVVAVPKKI